ncbi:hypothetical protein DY000_02004203 [Brassica cretica]|uniref:(S)-2-hydroxy-acid oxidase n=1 Tax=Brassica cretica TaxID=69181 RepID=A0ABQ7C8V9_BRACR|nr:hypothetical protein DY000_02004203 [Brassica cretica]
MLVYKNKNVVEQLVRRAERAGFKAIALTVDTPRLGRRESDIKNRKFKPLCVLILQIHFAPNLTLKNFEGLDLGKMDEANDSGLASYVAGQIDRTLSWKDVQWLQTITKMPILVKGVLTGEDARIAVQAGAAGIIVSNHGARQLDYVPATISALEEVVKATQGRIPVFLDGGVRRGTDVFKALALGASGIFASIILFPFTRYSCLKPLIVLITCPLHFRLEDQWYSHWLLKERLESERCFKCYAMSLS